MTPDDFREMALAMNGAVERSHMNHPDFRANGRIFASIMPGERKGTLKLTPEEQLVLMRQHRTTFSPAAGAWGRQGWTHVEFAEADEGAVRAAMLLAWQSVVERKKQRKKLLG
jgi:YjbR protein